MQRKILAAGLSAEQSNAATTLAAGGSALALLSGKAGTGKNRTLKPLIAQMREDGYRVILGATAWRTVEMGTAELDGVEGRALDSWRAIAQGVLSRLDAIWRANIDLSSLPKDIAASPICI